jgi:hypothetical protein
MMKHVLAALCVLAPLSAAAQSASSISDCEKIKNDMAYNQCLASFGPKMGERAPRVQVGEDPESSVAERPASRGRQVARGRRGRQSMSFDVVSGGSREVRREQASPRRSYRTRGYSRRGHSRRRR